MAKSKLYDGPPTGKTAPPRPVEPEKPARRVEPEKRGKKERFTVQLPPELIELTRDAVWHFRGLTLSALAEAALRKELRRLARKHGAIPQRGGDLQPGRPVQREK